VKTFGESNDAVPEDEMELAKLLQNAGAFGLKSCRGTLYKGGTMSGHDVTLHGPPAEAYACCAIGASMLASDTVSSGGGRHYADGNDATTHEPAPDKPDWLTDWDHAKDLRRWNIGAAFEIAARGGL
jgi:hypothetical protein